MTWDKDEQCFVGYGWKKIKCLDVNGNVSVSKLKKNVLGIPLGNYWYEATGSKQNNKKANNAIVSACEARGDDTLYFPGFHIFRDFEDAVNYPHVRGSDVGIVKVKFSELLTIGTNYTGYDCTGNPRYGVCYVSKYMQILDVYDEDTKGLD